jgi:hypothetical protein
MSILHQALKAAEDRATKAQLDLDEANDSIRKIKTAIKKECPHTHIKTVDREYFEEGRMSSPATWKEQVCTHCGYVVAQGHTQTRTEWGPGESLPR